MRYIQLAVSIRRGFLKNHNRNLYNFTVTFFTLYTNISEAQLKDRLHDLTNQSFSSKCETLIYIPCYNSCKLLFCEHFYRVLKQAWH